MSKTTTVSPAPNRSDGLSLLLDSYRQTAVRTLGIHLREDAHCSACGQRWPCPSACSAEVALELE